MEQKLLHLIKKSKKKKNSESTFILKYYIPPIDVQLMRCE